MKKILLILLCLPLLFSSCSKCDDYCDCTTQSHQEVKCASQNCGANTLNSCGYCVLHTNECCD